MRKTSTLRATKASGSREIDAEKRDSGPSMTTGATTPSTIIGFRAPRLVLKTRNRTPETAASATMRPMAGPKRPSRPRDPNQLGKLIVDLATGEAQETVVPETPAQVNGRSGGLKGGKARAAKLSPQARSESAKKAAQARWGA